MLISSSIPDVILNSSLQIKFLYKTEKIWGFHDSDDSYCEGLNMTLCVVAGVWNAYDEDEENIFFRNLGDYDNPAQSHSLGLL